jgi:hypothetical protein
MQKFQNLQNCDTIANYYADVLFSLFQDVTKTWEKDQHAIAKNASGTRFIRFTDDYNPATHSSSLQVKSTMNTELFSPGIIIFASCLEYSAAKVKPADTAIMFFYGKPDYSQLIRRYADYFTTQEFNGPYAAGAEQPHNYSDGGPACVPVMPLAELIPHLDEVIAKTHNEAVRESTRKYREKIVNFKSRSKIENFRRISLVAQMKHDTFAAGRKLGQKSKSAKKQAAARANGKKAIAKIGKRYRAEIDYAEGYRDIEFDTGVDCFKYFSGAHGNDKIFRNYSEFSRKLAQGNGEYHYRSGKMKVSIYLLVLKKPTSKNIIK